MEVKTDLEMGQNCPSPSWLEFVLEEDPNLLPAQMGGNPAIDAIAFEPVIPRHQTRLSQIGRAIRGRGALDCPPLIDAWLGLASGVPSLLPL
jgi:hypothetical protein